MVLFFLINFIIAILGNFSFSQTLESDLNKVAKDCRHSEAELAQIELSLQDVKSLYHQKTEHLQFQQKKLVKLIILLKNLKSEAPSRIIESTQKSSQVLRSFAVLQCYIQNLHKQIHNLQKEVFSLNHMKEETVKRKEELDKKLLIYQKKYSQLESLLKQRKEKIQKTLSQRKEKEEKAKRLAERSQSLMELVKNLEKEQPLSKASLSFSTHLLAPVEGPLISDFNQKNARNPDGSGVVFRARPGAHALSPVTGKVLYAGPFRRYNKILIIGFQKKYLLLLTGLDRLDVSVGQELQVGDPIGRLPLGEKSYLYLELRNHGIPIKPTIMKT